MTIGQLAFRAGVAPATVRYYERRGLIAAAPRTTSGYRRYGLETVGRLQFIKRAQGIGFSLQDIHELLALHLHDAAACPHVQARAEEKIRAIKNQMRELKHMWRLLESLVKKCSASRAKQECPLLATLVEDFGSERI